MQTFAPVVLWTILAHSAINLTSALRVTEPAMGTVWSTTSPTVITWTDVATSDPASVDVILGNNNGTTYPNAFKRTLATGVNSSAQSFTLPGGVTGLKPGVGYQISITSADGNILAQSPQFLINTTSVGPANMTTNMTTNMSSNVTAASPTSSTTASQMSSSSDLRKTPSASPSAAAHRSSASTVSLKGLGRSLCLGAVILGSLLF